MRRQMKYGKFIFTKNMAFVIVWCILIGSIHIPVYAGENAPDESPETVSSNNVEENNNMEKDEAESGGGEEPAASEEELISGHDTEEKKPEDSGDKLVPGNDAGMEEPGDFEEEMVSDKEEIVSGNETEEESKDSKEETISNNNTGEEESKDSKEETISGNETEEESKDSKEETVSGNDIGEESKDSKKETISGNDMEKEEEKQEIVNVVVPSACTLALNPYRLPIKTGEDEISEEQIISGVYGIVNKSSTDQIVTVSITVEDSNGGKVVFVDSPQEAEDAGKNIYAVYLSVVPANEEEILIEGRPADKDISGEALQNVEMTGAQEQAVALHEGTNKIAFKLSGAVYDSESKDESAWNDPDDGYDPDETLSEGNSEIVLRELAPDGSGVTAYTFHGVMNPNASWEELPGGIKLSVTYTYQRADGNEEIIEGTGAMVSPE